ncbi:MAG: tetratricopeptide repeat protein [Gemmatimonadaceae bacterium]|nr:tetratricopeptide repeat protein [Gemmatimonadaceae bacterium]
MAIRGSLKEASLPDVLQLLAMGKKTGCLSVTHRSNFGSIYFDKGRISYASIVNRRDRIGDILVKSGVLTQEQLDLAIAIQSRKRDTRLGEILVGEGMLSRDDLHTQIRSQIEEAVYFLFTWTQGTFNFEADIRPEEQDYLVAINPESLLLEGARRVDEWSLIEKKIPSFDLVFEVDQARLRQSGVALTTEQETIITLLDGRRDVQALIDETGMVEFDVGKALYGLATAGFLHRVGKTKTVAEVAPDARVDEHRNLGIAFFKTGMLDEASREFKRVLDLRADDAHARSVLGLVYARQGRWELAEGDFRTATESRTAPFAVHHNLAFALERLARPAEAQRVLDEARRRGGESDPRVQTTVGVLALQAGELIEADAAFMAARPLFGKRPPSAVWFHYAALTAALNGQLDKALALLTEGVELHPHAAPLHNNLAVVLERKGKYAEALARAEAGIQEEPGLAPLHKNAGDALYRSGRFDEALEAYGRAIKFNDALGPDVYLRLGNIRLKRGERDEALRCWERALELDPGNEIVRTNLDALRGRGG